jgi:hypothetical protein
MEETYPQHHRPKTLPLPVIAIAGLEFMRAVLIIVAALSPLRGHTTAPVPFSAVQVITLNPYYFVASADESDQPHRDTDPAREKSDAAMNVLMAAPFAILATYIGFGLLFRKQSGLALAAFSSILTVLYWMRGFLFSWAWHDLQKYFTSPQTKSNIFLALLLNLLIFLYLIDDHAVHDAFWDKPKRPTYF